MRGQFDYVLIDTPPLESVADALRIATHADGVVLVVRSGRTSRKLVADAAEKLRRTGAPILGVVLSRAEMDRRGSATTNAITTMGTTAKGTAINPAGPKLQSIRTIKSGGNCHEKENDQPGPGRRVAGGSNGSCYGSRPHRKKTALCRLTRIRTS